MYKGVDGFFFFFSLVKLRELIRVSFGFIIFVEYLVFNKFKIVV